MPQSQRSQQSKYWCFTLNNYTVGEQQLIAELLDSEHCSYGIIGRERGDGGTPHLQGFVAFTDRKTFVTAKRLLGDRVHLEKARGKASQAADYCKKEGDYDEYGSLPTVTQGKRSDWERLRDYLRELGYPPSEAQLYDEFPSLMGRYRDGVRRFCRELTSIPREEGATPREWQQELATAVEGVADNRKVRFVVDPDGNNGKSWFCRWFWRSNRKETQLLKIGKRDDLAHCIDESKTVFLIDVPRGQMEFLQYPILESLKDGFVFSPKYDSCMKEMRDNCHVVVFSNEHPDYTAMTSDRYDVMELSSVRFNE